MKHYYTTIRYWYCNTKISMYIITIILNAGDTYTMINDYNTAVNTYEKAGNAYKSAAEVDNISPEERVKYYIEAAEYYNNAKNYEKAALHYLFAAEANNKHEYYKNADKSIRNTSFYNENNNIKYSWEILKNKYNDNTDSKEYKAITNRINAL